MSLFSLPINNEQTGGGSAASPLPWEEKSTRAAWNANSTDKARCDLANRKFTMSKHAGLAVFCLYQKSVKGRLLTDIKADDNMVEVFAAQLAETIQLLLGKHVAHTGWAVCATPRRRHLTNNFACRIAQQIATKLGLVYYEDVAWAATRQRVDVEFTLGTLPKESNILVVDDFVTTGSTIKAMDNLLQQHGKTCLYFVAINNNF